MNSSTVTIKGQVVIPAKLRKKYGLKKGSRVRFEDQPRGLRLIPINHDFIDQNLGCLRTGGKLIRTLMDEKRHEREL